MSRKLTYFHLVDDPMGWNFNWSSDQLNMLYDNWTPAVRTRCLSTELSFDCPLNTFSMVNFDTRIAALYKLTKENNVSLHWKDRLFDAADFELVNLWICRAFPETKVFQSIDYVPLRIGKHTDALNATGSHAVRLSDYERVNEYVCVHTYSFTRSILPRSYICRFEFFASKGSLADV